MAVKTVSRDLALSEWSDHKFLAAEESSTEESSPTSKGGRRWGSGKASNGYSEPSSPPRLEGRPHSASSESGLAAVKKALTEHVARCLPTDKDVDNRVTTMQSLRSLVLMGLNAEEEDIRLHRFGSAASGFGERGSDLDVAVELCCSNSKIQAQLAEKKITDCHPIAKACIIAVGREVKEHPTFQVVGRILSAKVPLLMLRDKYTGLSCDVSFGNLKGVTNTALLRAYAELDERLVHVVLVVKKWAKAAGVSGSKRGYLSAYALTLMVIFFFQVAGELPSLQQHSSSKAHFLSSKDALARGLVKRSGLSSAELLIAFFEYYIETFDWAREVVSVRLGERISAMDKEFVELKHRRDTQSIHIEDPFELQRNLNCVLYGADAALDLREAMEDALKQLEKGKGSLNALFVHHCCACHAKVKPKPGPKGKVEDQYEEGGREDETTDEWYCDGCWNQWERQRSAKKANKYPLPRAGPADD